MALYEADSAISCSNGSKTRLRPAELNLTLQQDTNKIVDTQLYCLTSLALHLLPLPSITLSLTYTAFVAHHTASYIYAIHSCTVHLSAALLSLQMPDMEHAFPCTFLQSTSHLKRVWYIVCILQQRVLLKRLQQENPLLLSVSRRQARI